MRPQSLRNFGVAAVRIHTMKRSSACVRASAGTAANCQQRGLFSPPQWQLAAVTSAQTGQHSLTRPEFLICHHLWCTSSGALAVQRPGNRSWHFVLHRKVSTLRQGHSGVKLQPALEFWLRVEVLGLGYLAEFVLGVCAPCNALAADCQRSCSAIRRDLHRSTSVQVCTSEEQGTLVMPAATGAGEITQCQWGRR